MRAKDIQGLKPSEIQHKFSLPSLPTQVSDVKVPAGTKMQRGIVAKNFGGGDGATQYYLMEQIDSGYFMNTRPL